MKVLDGVTVEPSRSGFIAISRPWKAAVEGATRAEAIQKLSELIALCERLDARLQERAKSA
jgi:hypothetical protein